MDISYKAAVTFFSWWPFFVILNLLLIIPVHFILAFIFLSSFSYSLFPAE